MYLSFFFLGVARLGIVMGPQDPRANRAFQGRLGRSLRAGLGRGGSHCYLQDYCRSAPSILFNKNAANLFL